MTGANINNGLSAAFGILSLSVIVLKHRLPFAADQTGLQLGLAQSALA